MAPESDCRRTVFWEKDKLQLDLYQSAAKVDQSLSFYSWRLRRDPALYRPQVYLGPWAGLPWADLGKDIQDNDQDYRSNGHRVGKVCVGWGDVRTNRLPKAEPNVWAHWSQRLHCLRRGLSIYSQQTYYQPPDLCPPPQDSLPVSRMDDRPFAGKHRNKATF